MIKLYDLKVTESELNELNGFVDLLDCSEMLKNKVNHLVGYARLLSKAERTKERYDLLVSSCSDAE